MLFQNGRYKLTALLLTGHFQCCGIHVEFNSLTRQKSFFYGLQDQLFMTGHLSGCVNFYSLEPAEDWGLFRAKSRSQHVMIIR